MAFLVLFTLIVGGLVALTAWRVLVNLYLHPLAGIPGPKIAAISTLYEMYYDFVQPGQYPFRLKELHDKYGPIIRPVPDQVHISDPDFLETIYAFRNRNQPVPIGLNVDESVAGASDWSLHRNRREALNPYFSQKNVINLEPLLVAKRDHVVSILNEHVGVPINLSDIFFAFSNDFVRTFAFGNDDGLLTNLPEAHQQRSNLLRLLRSVPLNYHFPWIPRVLGNILPVLFGDSALPPGVMDLIRFKKRISMDITAVFAERASVPKGHSIFYELRDSPVLPAHERTPKRLLDEATIIVMAGTGSTQKSLNIAIFYLLLCPNILSRLRDELITCARQQPDGRIPLSVLLTLPYLAAVIHETNRLSFGVTRRMVRYSPTETLSFTASTGPYAGTTYVLPPGTKMSQVTYCTHTNETLFPDPWSFEPERWIVGAEDGNNDESVVARRKRCMNALGKGHRRCVGIHVANSAMSLVLAELATRYEMELYKTDESDVKFQHDYQISHPRLDSEGVRVIIKRLL